MSRLSGYADCPRGLDDVYEIQIFMPKTVAEQIADQLRGEILAGVLPPGARLFQDVEAARLEVSRTPLREAFRQLEGERLVQIIPNRRAIVTRLTPEEVAEIYQIRGQLEPLAATRAARLATPEEVRAIGALLEELEEARTQGRTRRLLELNKSFHFRVYEASGMPRLVNIISSLWGPIEAMRAAYASEPVTARHAADEHARLFRAIRDRDEDEAAAVTHRHVETMTAALLGWMEGASRPGGTGFLPTAEAAPSEGGDRGSSDEDPPGAGREAARSRVVLDGRVALHRDREDGVM